MLVKEKKEYISTLDRSEPDTIGVEGRGKPLTLSTSEMNLVGLYNQFISLVTRKPTSAMGM